MPLYPEIAPYHQFQLPVGQGHTLYVEESGNRHGFPVVVLHGGPGGGCSGHLRRFFDPAFWRIILFDQRGAGRSTPAACVEHNSTDHLVADIEAIRAKLGVDRWLVFGGSWGATLGLRYSQNYPDHVAGAVLRGIFLCRDADLAWLYAPGGASRLRPEAWQAFMAPLSASEQRQPLLAYHARLHDGNNARSMGDARAWAGWEAACATLLPSASVRSAFAERALALARIETHYFINGGFLGQPLLRGMSRMAAVPGIIVHGRYDLVCPADQAVALHQAWPGSELCMVSSAGHSLAEPGIEAALLRAVATMQARLTGAEGA
ncbi:MAG: prolyl aminopeptidase [Alcanivoracaceae bacterium]|nr:prolyl aminopeptidase [Alcanivoracaceae bacterium]